MSTRKRSLHSVGVVDPAIRLGHPVVDRYLEFVEARARRNTLLATASDLRVFFTEVDKEPSDVSVTDVLAFITAQRSPLFDGKVIRLSDGETGLSARTIQRRLSIVSGFFAYLVMVGESRVEPCAPGTRHPPGPKRTTFDGAAHPHAPHAAQDPRTGRGRRTGRRPAPVAGPGHGRGHGPRRAPAL